MDARTISGLVRPFTMLAPLVGVVAGAATAASATGAAFRPELVALAALAAVLANGASNAWNQAYDADIDRVNKPTRPIPAGAATVAGALRLGHVCALLGLLVAGAHAALVGRVAFLACVAGGVVATWAYSAPPWRTKARLWLANPTIAVPRGFLVPVAGWAVLAPVTSVEPFALGLVPGLFVLGAATTKDFADVEGDRAHGCRTLPVVLGLASAARVVAPFLVLPFLLYPLLALLGAVQRPFAAWAVAGALLAAGGAWTARALLRDPSSLATERNHPAWRGMYLLMLANYLVVLAVYVAAR
ncbi:MAG: UbiA family prenyltransferase [Planctomycetia bacterium]|nr:UbiA family prenyltransferase [Planctomycetia bacterium]